VLGSWRACAVAEHSADALYLLRPPARPRYPGRRSGAALCRAGGYPGFERCWPSRCGACCLCPRATRSSAFHVTPQRHLGGGPSRMYPRPLQPVPPVTAALPAWPGDWQKRLAAEPGGSAAACDVRVCPGTAELRGAGRDRTAHPRPHRLPASRVQDARWVPGRAADGVPARCGGETAGHADGGQRLILGRAGIEREGEQFLQLLIGVEPAGPAADLPPRHQNSQRESPTRPVMYGVSCPRGVAAYVHACGHG